MQKNLANPKPEQPHDPKGNKEPNANRTDFLLVRVRVWIPHSCYMGARVSEPPKTLELPKQILLRFKYSTVLKLEIFCFAQMGLFFICTHFNLVKNDSQPSKMIVCPKK